MELFHLDAGAEAAGEDEVWIVGEGGVDIVCLELFVPLKLFCPGLTRLLGLLAEDALCASEGLFIGVCLDWQLFDPWALVGVRRGVN